MAKNAVVYTVSGPHILLCATSIASLIDHYQSEDALDILVVTEGELDADVALLRELPDFYQKPQVHLFVWQKPPITSELKHYDNARFGQVTLWRLFVPAYFPNYEQLLMIDNDTIIMADIAPLFSLNRPGNVMAAVPDFYYYTLNPPVDQNVLPDFSSMKAYFNSGVLVINVALYNELFKPEMLVERADQANYQYPDQTLLNMLTAGKVTLLPFRYNFQKDDDWLTHWAEQTDPAVAADMTAERQHVVIRHFLSNLYGYRPWGHLAVMDEFEAAFWQYFSQTREFFTTETKRRGLNHY
ncbi:glycosyltransferase [Lacticaseibacillus salsurivasis]|uniref:glycosyltransferase n=1 Tax=Lacticaseibacillus salsurivasis TaxID=3081441 RepID=UPI0030C6FEF6